MSESSPCPGIPVHIKMRDGTSISMYPDRFEPVLKLKEALADQIGLFPNQQRLVYAGKLLSDHLSLDFYQMRPGAQIYFVPISQPARVGHGAYDLLMRLIRLLSDLSSAQSRHYPDIVREIAAICMDSTVQAHARIDSHAKQLLADAEEIVAMSKRPTSRRTRQFLARGDDLAFYPYDASPRGFLAMKAMLDSEDSEKDEEDGISSTTTFYRKRISNQPLPNAWILKDPVLRNSGLRISMPANIWPSVDERKATFECRAFPSSKSEFSDQVEVLKDMGFADETIILEALVQTNGNVQLAAKLLQRHTCD